MTAVRRIRDYRMASLRYYWGIYWALLPRRIGARKAWNALRALAEWKAGITTPSSRPFAVRVEPSATCNLRCPSCATPKRTWKTAEIRRMSLETFKTVYEQIAPAVLRLTLYMRGEPMTHPELLDMVELAGRDGVFTSFCTNFTLIRPELVERLIHSKLDWLSVCLDGISPDVYAKYRVNGDVERVKDGIRRVMDYRRKHSLKRPFLNVYCILFPHVVPEADQVEAYCKQHGVDQLTFRPDEKAAAAPPALRSWRKCFWPWLSLSVEVDGSVYPCPIALSEKLPIGDLSQQTLDEIWNGPKAVAIRRFLTGRGSSEGLPCARCRMYGSTASAPTSRAVRRQLPLLADGALVDRAIESF